MNIQTVIANLLNTIEGKEQMLAEFKAATLRGGANLEAIFAMRKFLEINIGELKAILADCMAVREADVARILEIKDNNTQM